MLNRTLGTFLLFILTVLYQGAFSQQAITDVNVDQLTDEQVQKAIDEMNKRGLTLEEAGQLARARGASQQQIDQMTQRIQQLQAQGRPAAAQPQPGEGQDSLKRVTSGNIMTGDSLSKKALPEGSAKAKKIFGYQLFNNTRLSFAPAVNIPMPADYVLGIGDVLTVEVWGASQQHYRLEIGNNGSVLIPDLGPVQVAGLEYKEAKERIIRRLAAIYADIAGTDPQTFADISVNNLRSIKVNVIGEAITPGTYTLPATASAFNALYLSGGPNANGSFREIRVMRDNKLLTTIDVYDYLINANTAANITLRDQDILFIPAFRKRVETTGEFKRQAIFDLKEGETMADLMKYSGGLNEKADASRLHITRFHDGQYQLVDAAAEQSDSLPLQNGDRIHAEKAIDRYENRLTIEGAVLRPGTYALQEGMTLSALIRKAGGLREDHFTDRGLVMRLDNQLYPTTIPFNPAEVMKGRGDFELQREDQVIVRDLFSIGESKTIRIFGEVVRPGQYDFRRHMSLKDLIFLAGGMTEAASESFIEVARRNSYEEAGSIHSKMATLFQFRVGRSLALSADDEAFKLEPFDQVYVRRAPSYEAQQTVFIRGEVKYPGEYAISGKNERISELIERAGGITPYAFAEGAMLNRRVSTQMKNQLDRIRRLRPKGTPVAVDTLRKHNQLEIRLTSILEQPGTSDDYFLREGDEIIIPMKTEEIWVNGEVLNPVGLTWEKNKSMKYYIERSGGFSPGAKRNKAYVVYSNGTSKVARGFPFRTYPKVTPGSQIIVPAKPERKIGTGNWLAISSALSSLAIAFAAILK